MNKWVMIIAVGATTYITRLIPFLLFRKKEIPPRIKYLGEQLPTAVMAILIVYCLKDVAWGMFPRQQYALWAGILVIFLHAWKRNTLLSMLGGTLFYMIMVQGILLR